MTVDSSYMGSISKTWRHGALWSVTAVAAAATLCLTAVPGMPVLTDMVVGDGAEEVVEVVRPSRQIRHSPKTWSRGVGGGINEAASILTSTARENSLRRSSDPTFPKHEVVRSVLGLGDSVTSAAACEGCTPFVTLTAQRLADVQHTNVTVRNLGMGGATSADLLDLMQTPEYTAAMASAESVVITIGANDFDGDRAETADCRKDVAVCYEPELAELKTNIAEALRILKGARAGKHQKIVVTGYWNVFEDGDVAQSLGRSSEVSSSLTKEVNSILQAAADGNDAHYVDLDGPFHANGDTTTLLVEDGDHPSQTGHEVIAEQVIQALA